MTNNQANRKEMHDVVLEFLDDNAEKWSSIPKLVEFKNQLDGVNEQIELAHNEQQNARVYVGKSKRQLKKAIAIKADILNDILEAYAGVTNNVELAGKMSDGLSDLFRLRNNDFIPKIKEVVKEVEAHKEALTTEYGLNEEQLTDLKVDLNNYQALYNKPGIYRIASVQATKDLEILFSEANKILTDRLDKMMNIFKRRDTKFFNGYHAARTVIDN